MIRDNNTFDTMPSLYRSKTPTADLYSTEPKTILPIRPKTPLVNTRTRIITPSSELNISELEASLHMDLSKKNNFKEFLDHDAIGNNNAPSVNVVSNLTNHLNQLDLENNIYENKSDSSKTTKHYLNAASGGSNGLDLNSESIYSITSNNYRPTMPNHYIENEYSHENCYCYDCQDYAGRKQDSFQSNYFTLPPQMNDNVGKRLNQFINERRFNNTQDGQSNNANNEWEWPQKFTSNQVSIFFNFR